MSRDIRIEFGEKVRKVRKQKGLTQEELADRAGLHFTYIGQVERGKRNPSLINIHRIVKALHISISQIFPL
ncbi:XRE family transcriptional regulator [Candidatus Roizmanbacteria bacterium CG_4_10_14_0_2_um_filter_39_13]|uniref:XRE family transcriptional regulator n=1 Tax=Candidatus Roizmanbacteria bacterium CG_4_10_14_0_2_um_filter_39_13 TaxID=1974825 RepID=A0A2M7TWL6_9BACT|nr:MAG: XRE family transcriptional regulator [Candidatus Roizmanbacteria bacterium CG_4_10_14_0_2_um_filter_39_13]